ncbi:MAG: PilZ domain-containing protein [Terriglobales bacterium]
MDPHVFAEPPGSTADSRKTEEGVNYLRRLKAQGGGEEPSAAASGTTSAAPNPQTSYPGKERRRSPRFGCAGSVEFKAEGSDVRMWGTMTDVSLHGCYVEMSTTFPVGTKVDLILEALGIRVRAQGTVRVSYPFLAMGIRLMEIEPGQQVQLEQLLSALAGSHAPPNAGLAQASAAADAVAAADPNAFLAEIRRFFESSLILSREEFLQIAKRCRRP